MTLDSFIDSFSTWFVFMTAAEQYIELVYQGLGISFLWVLVFFVALMLGIYILTALLLGSFEESYNTHMHEFQEVSVQSRQMALACGFSCWAFASGKQVMDEESFLAFFEKACIENCHIREVVFL